jgi:hypothetical protein
MRRLSYGLCSLLVAIVALVAVPAGSAGAQSSSAGLSAADLERFRLEAVTKPEPLSRAERLHVQGMRSHYGLRTDAAFVKRLHSYPERFHAVRSMMSLWGNILLTPHELVILGVPLEIEHATPELDGLESRVNEILGAAHVNVFGTSTDVASNHVVVMVGSRAKAERALDGAVRADAVAYDVIPAPVPGPDDGNRRFGPAISLSSVRTDGRRGLVISFVGGPPVTDPDDPCQVDYRAFAIEHSGIVRLEVRAKRRFVGTKTGEPVSCTFRGYGRLARVELDRSLGDRPLVDAATNEAVPVFDGSTLLHPTWLPAGWERASEGGYTSDVFGSTWSRTFRAPGERASNSCTDLNAIVWLAQGPPPPPDLPLFDPTTVIDVVDVRGHTATRTFDLSSGTTSIRWTERRGAVVLDGYRSCPGASGVDLDTLTRIAQGLR